MNTAYIWGVGKDLERVYHSIDLEHCKIKGIIDMDSSKQGGCWNGLVEIYDPLIFKKSPSDFIVISLKNYQTVIEICLNMGIPSKKILAYFDEGIENNIFDKHIRKCDFLERKIEKLEQRLANAPYEYACQNVEVPTIKSSEALLDRLIREKCSLCRFGDGELEMILGNERPWFQKSSKLLGKRLLEVLNSQDAYPIIAIADNFSSLKEYNEAGADGIRNYLTLDKRSDLMKIIPKDKIYYDAYISRPYIMYRNKNKADYIFSKFPNVWKDRELLIIEGKYSRLGIGNDLFSASKSIRRIVCPEKDSFAVYDRILQCVLKNIREGELALISLGPTATVLAYDLTKYNIQALDIGQLDTEYEWYLAGAKKRDKIKNKLVAEVPLCEQDKFDNNDVYTNQIVLYVESDNEIV